MVECYFCNFTNSNTPPYIIFRGYNILSRLHWMKSVHIQSHSCPYFSPFLLNTARYSLCISPYSVQMREYVDQNNYEYEHFLWSVHCFASKHPEFFQKISSSRHCTKRYSFPLPNPQETADLVTFTQKSLMENFIFCAVRLSE